MSLSFHTAPGQMPSISHPSALCHPGKDTILLRRVAAVVLWLLPNPFLPFGQGDAWGFRAGQAVGLSSSHTFPDSCHSPPCCWARWGKSHPPRRDTSHLEKNTQHIDHSGVTRAGGCPELCQASANFCTPSLTLVTGRAPGIAGCCATE